MKENKFQKTVFAVCFAMFFIGFLIIKTATGRMGIYAFTGYNLCAFAALFAIIHGALILFHIYE